jgi:hypothetical protein
MKGVTLEAELNMFATFDNIQIIVFYFSLKYDLNTKCNFFFTKYYYIITVNCGVENLRLSLNYKYLLKLKLKKCLKILVVWIMVFNATFNNISVISWR